MLSIRRVEKYRPNSLDDVEGHQDIIATINKFVDSNVCRIDLIRSNVLTIAAIASSPALWASGNRQDLDRPRTRSSYIRKQEYATNGA